MAGSDEKYSRQPAYNEFLMPTCPPSYSEAIGISNPGPGPALAPAPPPTSAKTLSIMNVQSPASGSITAPVVVGPSSSFITCPNCYMRGKTNTKSTCQKSAHIICCLLCLFGTDDYLKSNIKHKGHLKLGGDFPKNAALLPAK